MHLAHDCGVCAWVVCAPHMPGLTLAAGDSVVSKPPTVLVPMWVALSRKGEMINQKHSSASHAPSLPLKDKESPEGEQRGERLKSGQEGGISQS